VKNEHEKFLLSLETPRLMNIPKEKLVRWHPEFDVESCKKIEQAILPQPPYVEKSTAKDVLGKNYDIGRIIEILYGNKIVFVYLFTITKNY